MKTYLNLVLALAITTTSLAYHGAAAIQPDQQEYTTPAPPDLSVTATQRQFLPIAHTKQKTALHLTSTPRINAPYFYNEVLFPEMAIFWLGKVSQNDNYMDVRVGYNQEGLDIRASTFDKQTWYDSQPSPDRLADFDALTLYLNLDVNQGDRPDAKSYRFIGQVNWWEDRSKYQASYQGSGSGWNQANLDFTAASGWRGGTPNDNTHSGKGWVLSFQIPFKSLGLSGPPPAGTIWGMGIALHDRDAAKPAPSLPDKNWPGQLIPDTPHSWGQLAFGVPTYDQPTSTPAGSLTIQHKLNGANVMDGEVGGGAICGKGLEHWEEWGNTSTPGSIENSDFNVQNQSDVSDWPCFSKYYITFPIDALPKGKVIHFAELTLHQMGNSGGGSWGSSPRSLIQIFRVDRDWDEQSLTWNNAPLAIENVASSWVDPIGVFPGWPGVPWNWDVSRAVAAAYQLGEPVRLALYSADSDYHSGKYFVSSDTADWNYRARPSLRVTWGNP